ncbi:hypothetical protein PLICRDRAFT_40583 [Plicaturopsis crispa FD-325 SS-3]|nr:hypothetical protein PLICRDRAFT_40583 [Plicaturopsis crispa FD-325 SS-3]
MSRRSAAQKVATRSTSTPRPSATFSRTKSLRLPRRPPHIPVPPSLAQHPLLVSPHSIFRRANSTPRLPSQEDEQWLGDMVPLRCEGPRSAKGGTERPRSSLSAGSYADGVGKLRGRPAELRFSSNLSSRPHPSSPPLTRWHVKPTASMSPSSAWRGVDRTSTYSSRSEPNLFQTEHGYFALSPHD